jgi:hypothetical protein
VLEYAIIAIFHPFLKKNYRMRERGDDMSTYHDAQTMHIQSATLLIKDLKRSIEFYRDILGFQLISSESGKAVHLVQIKVIHYSI